MADSGMEQSRPSLDTRSNSSSNSSSSSSSPVPTPAVIAASLRLADRLAPHDPSFNAFLFSFSELASLPDDASRKDAVHALRLVDLPSAWRAAGAKFEASALALNRALGPEWSVIFDLLNTDIMKLYAIEAEIEENAEKRVRLTPDQERTEAASRPPSSSLCYQCIAYDVKGSSIWNLPIKFASHHRLQFAYDPVALLQKIRSYRSGDIIHLYGRRDIQCGAFGERFYPLYFRASVGSMETPLGEPADMCLEYLEPEHPALQSLPLDLLRAQHGCTWPLPESILWPYHPGRVEFLRSLGPGVLVAMEFQKDIPEEGNEERRERERRQEEVPGLADLMASRVLGHYVAARQSVDSFGRPYSSC